MQHFLIVALLIVAVNFSVCQKCFDIDFDDFNPCSYHSKLILPYGDCGTELDSIQEASDAPLVTYYPTEAEAKYILLMVDPDAPSRLSPKMKFWRHWLVSDIPADRLSSDNVEKYGHVLTSYQGPLPPEGSGLHRYQFLLFKQPSTFDHRLFSIKDFDSSLSPERGKFDVNKFVLKNNLCNMLLSAYEYLASVDPPGAL